MRLAFPLVLAAVLFSVGVYGVLVRRNAVLVLASVELMLNAVNLNLVAFDAWWRDTLHAGHALTLFVITVAAAEIGVGLAVVLLVFRNRATSDLTRLRSLDERVERERDDVADQVADALAGASDDVAHAAAEGQPRAAAGGRR